MATGGNVLLMLCPEVEWTIAGDDYDSIVWGSEKPAITKKQFEDGFNKYDAWKAQKDAEKANAKQAILDRIGLTADELKIILG